MPNLAFSLLKELKTRKSASAMAGGSFMPPQPLPNSVKAKQIEQQEMQAQQAQDGASAGNEQMMQMQKAQEDAVNQLQQTQQQLAQVQSDMQNMQMQTQQQVQQAQMDAQQQINKAQMDAQYELQAEKIKNQQKLLSMQEKYTKSLNKESPNQSPILANQLKRVVKKVNRLKMASANPPVPAPLPDQDIVVPQQNRSITAYEKKYPGMPHANVLPSQRTQQQWNEQADWKRQYHLNNPVNKQIEQKVMNAPVKYSDRGFLNEVGDFYSPEGPNNAHAQFDSFKDNAFGEYKETDNPFYDLYANTVDNPLGFAGRAASNLYLGYVPNFATGLGGMAQGVYNLSPSQFGKGLWNFGKGVVEGGLSWGSGGLLGAGKPLFMMANKGLTKVAPRLASTPGVQTATQKILGANWSQMPLLGKPLNWLTNNSYTKYPAKAIGTLMPNPAYAAYMAGDAMLGGDSEEESANQQAPAEAQPYADTQMNNDMAQFINMLPQLINSFAPQQQQARRQQGNTTIEQRNDALFNKFNEQQNYYDELARRMNKSGSDKNKKDLYSPIAMLQRTGYHRPQLFRNNLEDYSRAQSYGDIGDFIREAIFNYALPYFTGFSPIRPDMAGIHKNLVNAAPYELPVARYQGTTF
jgi:hypothetical protein